MTKVVQQGQAGGNAVATKRVDFAYNGLGQFTTIDRCQNTGGSNIVAQTTFAYDDDNRLTDLDHKQSTTTLAGYDYGYDNMGRITSIDSFIEDVSTFTYDKTSQLTGADHTSPRADESYTYDDNGNRTGGSYDTDPNNLTVSDGTYNYEYDDEGNRTKKTDISTGDYQTYEWDHRNRLVSVTFYDSMDTETKSVDHTYDIFNRWLRRTTDPDGPSAVDTFFTYDGIEPILQFDGPADTDLTNRYLFGPAVDQILASENVTSLGSAGNILWALSDHLGTPRDIADQNEGTYATTVTNHRTYDSFGNPTAETNAAVDLIFGETGKSFDEITGFGNHLGRWLDSDLSQWLSQDPSGFVAGDPNLRRFVRNVPLAFVDPDGYQAQVPTSQIGPPTLDASDPAYVQWYETYIMNSMQYNMTLIPFPWHLAGQSYSQWYTNHMITSNPEYAALMNVLTSAFGRYGLSPNTIAIGPSVSGSLGLSASASAQAAFSPSWDPWDWRIGLLVSFNPLGFEPNIGASAVQLITISNAHGAEELSSSPTLDGGSATVGGDVGEVIGGTASVSNLSIDGAGHPNLTGNTPTAVNVGLGAAAGAEPASPFVQYGWTWGESISTEEVYYAMGWFWYYPYITTPVVDE